MRRLRRGVLLLAAALAAGPLLALGDPGPEELAENRRKLEQWKADPTNYARLLRELRDFLSLPPPDRERMRRLDEELYREKPSTRARLFEVMERYADWLERLPPEDRRRIREAPDRQTRLRLVREIRRRQWVEHLPRADREAVQKARGKDREQLIARLRQRERQRQREWARSFRLWEELFKKRPAFRRQDLPPPVKAFIKDFLEPRLSPEEKDRLNQAAPRPGQFPRVLVNLADRHPPALPGKQGPTHFGELPQVVRNQLSLRGINRPNAGPEPTRLTRELHNAEAKWPQYGAAVADVAGKLGVPLPYELWPARKENLSTPVREFLDKKLVPALDQTEEQRLKEAEGRWPNYPVVIQQLARKHNLLVPWLTLPGPREQWDVYRVKPRAAAKSLPDVPRQTLRLFAARELTEAERTDLGLPPGDPAAWERVKDDPAVWERLKRIYFQRHPKEVKRLRQAEQRKGRAKRQ